MTLPKRLQEKRDELVEKHNEVLIYFNNASFDSVYKNGFNACAALLLPEIKKLREALEFYSLKSNYSLVDEGRYYNAEYKCYELNEETYGDQELGTMANQALKSWQEFLGEESEGRE